MPDLMQQLNDARPTETELDRTWPEDQRVEALARILDTPSSDTRRPRRAAWLAAAATAAGLAVVPAGVGSDPAAAQADLQKLAMAAVSSEGPVIAEGTFLHVKTEALQQNSGIFGDGKTLDTNRESWIRWDGKTWAIDSRPSAGWREYQLFPRAAEPYLNNPTPESSAALPDDPDALRSNSPRELAFPTEPDGAWTVTNLSRASRPPHGSRHVSALHGRRQMRRPGWRPSGPKRH